MSQLAVKHGAVNLGQGAPDFAGPAFLKEAAARAIAADRNQYARMAGDLDLVQAISAKAQRTEGVSYDPLTEVTVYSGCTEAILCAVLAFCEPGDEVVVLEPFYDSYPACLAMAGATARYVPLRAPAFRWDPAELAAAFNERTRMLIFNAPHNPTGRVFDMDELQQVAQLAIRHDIIVVTDEVYEHLVFSGKHVSLATLPGMRERTVRLNSTGKTFSLTGWKVGYSMAPVAHTTALRTVHQFATFSTATPLQVAMVEALNAPDSYYEELVGVYGKRREFMVEMLQAQGLEVCAPEGTYFALADIRSLGFHDDVEFCRHLISEVGVAAIPISALYHQSVGNQSFVRFAFCKGNQTLEEAARRLKRLRPR
jgi:N-succinyldiaminopimelate aminotransferase